MQNNQPVSTDSLRDVMDRYSPIVGGRTGIVGEFLKVVARAVELAPAFGKAVAPSPVPVPDVIFTSRNLAGQTIMTNNIMLANTFKRMESLLQKGFAKASRPEASLDDRESFVSLAEQVQADAAILSKACFFSNPKGGTTYQFTLEPQPGRHIPLAQAFAAVKQDYKAGCGNEVEMIRLGTERPVILMRPVKGFRHASRKSPSL